MLLAIDSSTRVLSLALHDGQQIVAESTWNTPNRHTVDLLPAIQQMLAQANLAPIDLRLLAIAEGPGSFNGLRIGFSVAKGLALALHLPLIAIPTLDVIAVAQLPYQGRLVAVAQAGRGRVCAGSYQWQNDTWVSQSDVQIIAWEPLLKTFTDNTIIAGEVDTEGRTAINAANKQGQPLITIARSAFALRRAGFLAELAWERWHVANNNPKEPIQIGDPALLVPLYLHQPGVPHP